jgi:hypothetical protein
MTIIEAIEVVNSEIKSKRRNAEIDREAAKGPAKKRRLAHAKQLEYEAGAMEMLVRAYLKDLIGSEDD